jgi:Ca2+-binding EF-hand superfamily protein
VSPPHLPFSHPHALPPNLLSARRPPRSGDQAKAAAAAGGMTPKSRSLMADADQDDPLVQQFRKADLNKDGKLSQYEIKQMMITQLGYEADEAYVASLLEEFGDYDLDSDGAISLDEFEALFNHLGGMERVNAVKKEKERDADPLIARFRAYDSGNKGHLTQDDVFTIMTDLGYNCSEDYLKGTLEAFGSIDVDNSGVLEFEEFKELWKHLGADEVAGDVVVSQPDDEDDPLWKTFCEFDMNNDKRLSLFEVRQMMVSLGYNTTANYVDQLVNTLGSFDKDGNGVIGWDEFPALWEHLG